MTQGPLLRLAKNEPSEAFLITNLHIIATSPNTITNMYCRYLKAAGKTFVSKDRVLGFQIKDFVWVPWSGEYDECGEPIPNFYILGHEIWHKARGDFHPQTTKENTR